MIKDKAALDAEIKGLLREVVDYQDSLNYIEDVLYDYESAIGSVVVDRQEHLDYIKSKLKEAFL